MTTDDAGPAELRILVVEDNAEVAEVVQMRLQEELGAHVDIETSFDAAAQRIHELQPELLILDLLEGPESEGHLSGEAKVRARLEYFVPLVVYSAADRPFPNGPFETFVSKGGDNALDQVVECVRTFSPHVEALRDVHGDIHKTAMAVLRDAAGPIWDLETDPAKRTQLLVRTARRRVAAMMDVSVIAPDAPLLPWEKYIYPALGDDLLTGDILKQEGADETRPESFRLVLTPSCDLVTRGGRNPKVTSVLSARCVPMADYLQVCQVSKAKLKTDGSTQRELGRLLTQPQSSGFVALPGYSNVLPQMAVRLRDLELLALTDRGLQDSNGARFERVASVDSPFREAITWAYLQIAGRPGVPDRDIEYWIKEIADQADSSD